jgi:hypothetical protein
MTLHDITNSFCKNALKIDTLAKVVNYIIIYIFRIGISIFVLYVVYRNGVICTGFGWLSIVTSGELL